MASGGKGDNAAEVLFHVFIAAIVLAVAPVVILSFLGGYFIYWSWNFGYFDSLPRKLVRTGVVFLSGTYVLFLMWQGARNAWGPELLGFSNKFIFKKTALSYESFSRLTAIWIPVAVAGLSVPAAFIINLKEKAPSPILYGAVRGTAYFLTAPFQILALTILKTNWTSVLFVLVIYEVIWMVSVKALLSLGLSQEIANFAVLAPIFGIATFWGFFTAIRAIADEGNQLLSENGRLRIKGSSAINIGRTRGGRPLNIYWKDINHHVHVIGQPGSGKSVLLKSIYAQQIIKGEGLLMIDLKADLDVRSEFLGLCGEHGRLQDLQIIDLSRPEDSCGYNPLLRGNASELKDKIITALEWSEPYYKKVSERFVLNIMRGLVALRDEKEVIPTLNDLFLAISKPVYMQALAESLPESCAQIRDDLVALARELKKKETSEALTGIKTDLEVMLKSEFGQLLNSRESIDILDSIAQRRVVYVMLDGQTYGVTAKRVGRMILSDLRSASGAIVSHLTKEERPRFTVIVDEFSELVSNKELGQLFTGFLNRCRGSGIGIVIAHQSLGDFEDEQLTKQVLDSTETLFSFVQKDPESCEILAGLAGTKETWEKTEQLDTKLLIEDKTGRGTRKLVYEYIYHPNVFKSLEVGQAVYIAKKPNRHALVRVSMYKVPEESLTNDLLGQINRVGIDDRPLLDLKNCVLREEVQIPPPTNLSSDSLEIPEDFRI